jgi:hypothetical protein
MLTFVTQSDDARHKTCFVAMPVTTPPSYAEDLRDTDHFGHVLKHLFTPALEQAGYTVIPPKMLGAALIHAEIIRHLEQADLVLADLSNHNPNVFFELGIRTSLDRPVVLVKDARTAMVPFDLGTINVLTYDECLATWTLQEEIGHLADHVSSVPTDEPAGNAMWRYFGLTKRGGPAEAGSIEAKVDLLLTEITNLRLKPMALTPEETLSVPGVDLIVTALIRNAWQAILDAVARRSRVAWVQLSSTSEFSVKMGTLILAFNQDGTGPGFLARGSDKDLAEAIEEVVGFKPHITVKTKESPASAMSGFGRGSSGGDGFSDEPPF